VNQADHLIFIGFMGSGKSTIARKIARLKGMTSVDMDRFLEQEAGMTIPQIFETEGEEGFRAREHAFLKSMAQRDRCILSCGGGIINSPENRALLKDLGTVVYLEVSAQEAVSRISRPETRPLLQGKIPPEELLEQRRELYEEAADITFDTNGLSVGQVVRQVSILLERRGIL